MPDGGCFGTEEWILDHITDRCPVMYLPEFNMLFMAYQWAERGFLPFGGKTDGGWAEQPADLIAGLNIVYDEIALFEEQQAKENS